jgi:hypothetical protein
MKPVLSLPSRKIFWALIFIILCLIVANISTQVSRFSTSPSILRRLHFAFDFSREANIPTWYQSTTLLLCAIVLVIIALLKRAEHDTYKNLWLGLSLIFLYLSLDEGAALHDRLTDPMRAILDIGGVFYFAWVIPTSILVLGFVLTYLKFWFHLPIKTRLLFLLAGALYVGGALGIEMIGGNFADKNGVQNLTYELITSVEETFEMLGVAVFLYALLSYASVYMPRIQVQIKS